MIKRHYKNVHLFLRFNIKRDKYFSMFLVAKMSEFIERGDRRITRNTTAAVRYTSREEKYRRSEAH